MARHSCASLLISLGFSLKDIQEWLGHADITLTANIYSHLDTKRKQGIADSLASAVTA
ncbi:MAG: tyrosine-type recombinase/integrase [Oscillospiraceae bacterium]|nr:tyrosine-type recombinase/integrase [Oscillospiraceae bacterium]